MKKNYIALLILCMTLNFSISEAVQSKQPQIDQQDSPANTEKALPISQMDVLGNTLAVWIKDHQIFSSIQYTSDFPFFNIEKEWSTPHLVAQSEQQLRNLVLTNNIKNSGPNIQANYTLAWLDADNDQTTFLMFSSFAILKGMWQTPCAVFMTENQINHLDIAANSATATLIVWEEKVGEISVIKFIRRDVRGKWTAPQQLSSTDRNAFRPTIKIDEAGNGVVTWLRDSGQETILETTNILSDGSWVCPTDLAIL